AQGNAHAVVAKLQQDEPRPLPALPPRPDTEVSRDCPRLGRALPLRPPLQPPPPRARRRRRGAAPALVLGPRADCARLRAPPDRAGPRLPPPHLARPPRRRTIHARRGIRPRRRACALLRRLVGGLQPRPVPPPERRGRAAEGGAAGGWAATRPRAGSRSIAGRRVAPPRRVRRHRGPSTSRRCGLHLPAARCSLVRHRRRGRGAPGRRAARRPPRPILDGGGRGPPRAARVPPRRARRARPPRRHLAAAVAVAERSARAAGPRAALLGRSLRARAARRGCGGGPRRRRPAPPPGRAGDGSRKGGPLAARLAPRGEQRAGGAPLRPALPPRLRPAERARVARRRSNRPRRRPPARARLARAAALCPRSPPRWRRRQRARGGGHLEERAFAAPRLARNRRRRHRAFPTSHAAGEATCRADHRRDREALLGVSGFTGLSVLPQSLPDVLDTLGLPSWHSLWYTQVPVSACAARRRVVPGGCAALSAVSAVCVSLWLVIVHVRHR
ncbi:hypothetical protein EMIHUDRAFT_451648, partial [Emiliania huxleyi CCMP1516]|uniref:Uncharacterized protein n=2 Tax=Emiliania huxleyi TaxID=2903 RepID=A0A0D3IWH9_EMIH1